MHQIVRVEHKKDGWGFYRNPTTSMERKTIIAYTELKCMQRRHRENVRAACFVDGFIAGEMFCAFISLENLYNLAYKEEIRFLIKHDFVVYLLNVKSILEDTNQCFYRKEDIISKEDISNLFL